MRLLRAIAVLCAIEVAAEPMTLSCTGTAFPADATEQSLKKRFGTANVRSEPIDIGEGEMQPGTLVFPDDAKRKVEVLWKDPKRKRSPAQVRTRGTGWRTTTGIAVGDRMSKVEKRNGRPFTITGFAWDYGGAGSGWNGGALSRGKAPCDLTLWFFVPDAHRDENEKVYSEVIGEREFLTTHPAMKKLNPLVQGIDLRYR